MKRKIMTASLRFRGNAKYLQIFIICALPDGLTGTNFYTVSLTKVRLLNWRTSRCPEQFRIYPKSANLFQIIKHGAGLRRLLSYRLFIPAIDRCPRAKLY